MKKRILFLFFVLFFSVLFLCNLVSAIPDANTRTLEFSSCSISGIPSNVIRGVGYDVTILAKYKINKENAFNSGNCLNALLNFNIEMYEDDVIFNDNLVNGALFNPKNFKLNSIEGYNPIKNRRLVAS